VVVGTGHLEYRYVLYKLWRQFYQQGFAAVSTLVVANTTVNPDHALSSLVAFRTYFAAASTWFFQGSTGIFVLFHVYLVYRFGHVHFGRRQRVSRPPTAETRNGAELNSHDESDEYQEELEAPEFSTVWYICMILACGLGSGFYATCVSQTLASRAGHFYAAAGYRSQDELDLMSITISLSTWGLSGWSTYLMVAINMCLVVHCFELPMALRSCFYPILRHYTWGWMGDLIDTVAIVSTISGVTTVIGVWSARIVSGFIFNGWVDENATQGHITAIQNTIIWLITIVSTASVLSGLQGGVRILSGWAVAFACLLLFLVAIMDDTKFLLNLIAQETGHYLQTFFLLNFWTDAFGQLKEGSGRAVDGKATEIGWSEYVWI
jgi:choline-glycine betaine transporter